MLLNHYLSPFREGQLTKISSAPACDNHCTRTGHIHDRQARSIPDDLATSLIAYCWQPAKPLLDIQQADLVLA